MTATEQTVLEAIRQKLRDLEQQSDTLGKAIEELRHTQQSLRNAISVTLDELDRALPMPKNGGGSG